jgi:hypothetical protein
MGTTNYRLNHNGQVCFLRAVINDNFDSTQRRIRVEDQADTIDLPILFHRSENRAKRVYKRQLDKEFVIYRRGFSGSDGYDFLIKVPKELTLSTTDVSRLKAIVNTYKLISKRYTIIYE